MKVSPHKDWEDPHWQRVVLFGLVVSLLMSLAIGIALALEHTKPRAMATHIFVQSESPSK